MKSKLILFFLLTAGISAAQRSNLQKRLNAINIKHYLLVRYETTTGTMYYETDPDVMVKSRQHTLEGEKPTEFTAMGKKINLDMTFINPMKYNISVSTKFREDEIYKDIEKFTDAVTLVVNTATDLKIKLNPRVPVKEDSSVARLTTSFAFKDKKLFRYSSSWYSWYFQLLSSEDKKYKISQEPALANFVKDVVETSSEIFELITEKDFQTKRINTILNSYEELSSAEDYKSLNEKTKELKKRIEKYQGNLKDITSKSEKLKELLGRDVITVNEKNNKAGFGGKERDMADDDHRKLVMFYNYTNIVTSEFLSQVSDELQSENKIISGMLGVIKGIEEINYDKVIDAIIVDEINIEPGLTTNVVIKITPKEENTKEKEHIYELNISEFSYVVPEVSAGVAFTNISFPVFGLETDPSGKFKVKQSQEEINNYAILGMFNLLPNIVKSNYCPILQFGAGLAGVSKTQPLLGMGGGVRMFQPTDFSITLGGLWRWEKSLSGLTPGSLVNSTDELDRALNFKFIPRATFYLGIQYNF